MQRNSSNTPCRRIGLGRISSAPSKSEPRSTQSFSSEVGTPKSSGRCLKINNKGRLSSRCFSEDLSLQSKRPNAEEALKDKCNEISNSIFKKQKVDSADKTKTHSDDHPTEEDLNSLRRRVTEKEKQLQELHQAQVICKKHDPRELKEAIQKWRIGCQEALQVLLTTLINKGHQIEMIQLLQELGIPSALVHFNHDIEEFE